jgi:hypothetical protein
MEEWRAYFANGTAIGEFVQQKSGTWLSKEHVISDGASNVVMLRGLGGFYGSRYKMRSGF